MLFVLRTDSNDYDSKALWVRFYFAVFILSEWALIGSIVHPGKVVDAAQSTREKVRFYVYILACSLLLNMSKDNPN